MKAFIDQKQALKKAFAEISLKGFEAASPKVFFESEYFNLCIETNEINGIEFFVSEDYDGAICFPKFIEGVDGITSVREIVRSVLEEMLNTIDFAQDSEWDFKIREYWQKKDFDQLLFLSESDDPYYIMSQSLIIAQDVLSRSPEKLAIVCGPMSTGKKTVEENLRIFNRTVFKIAERMPTFNQLPFEHVFHKVHELIKEDKNLCIGGGSSYFFINNFYKKLFMMKKEWEPHFIHGWQHSLGAKMEHSIFTNLKIPRYYLRPGFEEKLF